MNPAVGITFQRRCTRFEWIVPNRNTRAMGEICRD
jgi:hypothetical protein